jgi:hypothetical protein
MHLFLKLLFFYKNIIFPSFVNSYGMQNQSSYNKILKNVKDFKITTLNILNIKATQKNVLKIYYFVFNHLFYFLHQSAHCVCVCGGGGGTLP